MNTAKYAEYLLKNQRSIKREIEIMEMELKHYSTRQNCPDTASTGFIGTLAQADNGMSDEDMYAMVTKARHELKKLEMAIDTLDEDEKGVIVDLYIRKLNWNQTSEKRFISNNTLSRRRKKAIEKITGALTGSNLRTLVTNDVDTSEDS